MTNELPEDITRVIVSMYRAEEASRLLQSIRDYARAAVEQAEKERDFLVEEYERAVRCGPQGYLHAAMHLFNAITNAQIDAKVAAIEQDKPHATDEQGRPMTYWGGLAHMNPKPIPRAAVEQSPSHADWRTALDPLMPHDFKDWWQNAASELPQVAAWCITRARESERDAWEHAMQPSPVEQDKPAAAVEIAELRAKLQSEQDAYDGLADWVEAHKPTASAEQAGGVGQSYDDFVRLANDPRRERKPEQASERDAAKKRLARFVAMWDAKPMRGLDQEIYCIHTGTEWEACITVADLRAITTPPTASAGVTEALLSAAREVVEMENEPRFLHGAIKSLREALSAAKEADNDH